MPLKELVHYATYGSLTREVAEILLNKKLHFAPARVPDHAIRYITPDQMSKAEQEVMRGSSRFIAVPDHRHTHGIKGGIIFDLPQEEVEVLQFFDNSSPEEYEVKTLEIVALQGVGKQIENRLPAILVARKKIGTQAIGQWRDAMTYNPYEPFSQGIHGALEIAQEVRETYLQLNSH